MLNKKILCTLAFFELKEKKTNPVARNIYLPYENDA